MFTNAINCGVDPVGFGWNVPVLIKEQRIDQLFSPCSPVFPTRDFAALIGNQGVSEACQRG